jgi:hypothetical protein
MSGMKLYNAWWVTPSTRKSVLPLVQETPLEQILFVSFALKQKT